MKYTYRLSPVSIYDIGSYESWLADKSEQGLFFQSSKKVRVRFMEFVRFAKGKPERRRYRLEPVRSDAKYPPPEEQELYEEMGWRYAGSLRDLFWVFEAPDRVGIPELHTDPAALGELYERVCRRLKTGWAIAAWIPYLILVLMNVFLIPRNPLYTFLTGISCYYMGLMLCLLLYSVVMCLHHILPMQRLREQLARGEDIDHNAPYRKAARAYILQSTAVLTLFLLVFGSEINTIRIYRCEEFSVADNLPVPVLSDLEGEGFQYAQTEWFNKRPYVNYVLHEWNPLTPKQYKVFQEGMVGQDNSSIQTAYYRVRFSGLAEPLFQSIFEEYVRKQYRYSYNEDLTLRRLPEEERAGFEDAVLIRDENGEALIARRNHVVVRICYDGPQNLISLIPQIFAAVTSKI